MIFRFFFRLFGWKLEGQIPADVKQAIYAVCPHNKWLDFPIGLGVRASMRRTVGFLGKEELFRPPFGFVFKWLGGTPVYRTEKRDMVTAQVEAIKGAKSSFAIAPEGTRKNVSKLRSGFYYMAHGAGIPIIMVGFDLEKKEGIIAEPFLPSGNYQEDMQKYFVPFFEKIGGFQKDWIQNYKKGIF
jgi:1-acyl-sn-glycerol-3-phosphate acyltransferase